jgi:hypothetical protein
VEDVVRHEKLILQEYIKDRRKDISRRDEKTTLNLSEKFRGRFPSLFYGFITFRLTHL